jgi:hypothetical protein
LCERKASSNTFISLSYDDKLKITEEGAPKPNLNLLITIKTCTRHFNTSLYKAIPWLCGCDKLNKLFCWPCFLFSKEKHVFNSAGYNIYKSDKRHRHSVNHIACPKEITLFGKNSRIEFPLSSQYKQSTEKHNETVKQNRKIVGQLQQFVFWGLRA